MLGIIGVFLNYLGDASSYPDGFRIKQTTLVTLGQSKNSNIPPSKAAGLTVNFGRPSPVNGNISTADFDYSLRDRMYLNNFDYASLDNLRMTAVNGARFSQLRFQGLGNDPLEPKIGGIQWNLTTKIDVTNHIVTTAGFHTCYPAHKITVGKETVYAYRLLYDNTVYLIGCLTGGFAFVPVAMSLPLLQY